MIRNGHCPGAPFGRTGFLQSLLLCLCDEAQHLLRETIYVGPCPAIADAIAVGRDIDEVVPARQSAQRPIRVVRLFIGNDASGRVKSDLLDMRASIDPDTSTRMTELLPMRSISLSAAHRAVSWSRSNRGAALAAARNLLQVDLRVG